MKTRKFWKLIRLLKFFVPLFFKKAVEVCSKAPRPSFAPLARTFGAFCSRLWREKTLRLRLKLQPLFWKKAVQKTFVLFHTVFNTCGKLVKKCVCKFGNAVGKVWKSPLESRPMPLEKLEIGCCGKVKIGLKTFRFSLLFAEFSTFWFSALVFWVPLIAGFSSVFEKTKENRKKFSTIVHRFSFGFPSCFRFWKYRKTLLESRLADLSTFSADSTAFTSVNPSILLFFYAQKRIRFARSAKEGRGVSPHPLTNFLKKVWSKTFKSSAKNL